MILAGMDDLPRITIINNYTAFTIQECLATHDLESFEKIGDEYIWALETEEDVERMTILEVREQVRRQQAVRLESDMVNTARLESERLESEDRLAEEINNYEVIPMWSIEEDKEEESEEEDVGNSRL